MALPDLLKQSGQNGALGGYPGTFGVPADTQEAVNTYAAMPQQPKSKGTAWKILGILGDALQTAGGGKATFMPAILQQQNDLQDRVDAERKWQAELALRNQPTAEMRNYEYYARLDPTARQTFDSYRRGDPNVTLTLPNDLGIYSGPQSGLGSALRGVTGQGVSSGVPQVSDQRSYDAVPVGGQYMTPDGHIRTKGGPAGNGGGGFR